MAILLPCLASAVDINCNFSVYKIKNVEFYACSVDAGLNVTIGDRTILDITGNHIEGRTTLALAKLVIKKQIVDVIPRPLAAYVPKLHILSITESKLTVLTRDDLKGLKSLEQLYLGGNFIEVLLPNTFEFTTRLTIISLRQNKLKNIASNIFAPLKGLVSVHLDLNPCISASLTPEHPNESITTLMGLINQKCSLPYPLNKILDPLSIIECEGCTGGNDIVSSLLTKTAVCLFSVARSGDYIVKIAGDVKNGLTGRAAPLPLEINNPAIKSLIFRGLHLASKTNLDVTSLVAVDQIIKFIPQNMFEDFINLKIISITKSNLISITKKTFANLPKLVDLNLSGNELSLLDVNTFLANPLLQSLDLSGNKIEIISKLSLNGLTNLKVLNIAHNLLSILPADLLNLNLKLETILLNNNLLTKIPDLFSNLPSLKVTNLIGNLCVNELLESTFDNVVGNILKKVLPLNVLPFNVLNLGKKVGKLIAKRKKYFFDSSITEINLSTFYSSGQNSLCNFQKRRYCH